MGICWTDERGQGVRVTAESRVAVLWGSGSAFCQVKSNHAACCVHGDQPGPLSGGFHVSWPPPHLAGGLQEATWCSGENVAVGGWGFRGKQARSASWLPLRAAL